MSESDTRQDSTWVPCPDGCDDFYCVRHDKHVADCECPAIDVWVAAGLWPY